jgi:PKD repeat protein
VWEGPGVTNATTGNFDPAIGPGDYTLTFWFESPVTGCADSAFQVIHVSPVPTASFTLDPSGCTNAPADIQNNSLGATQYEWDFGNGFSIAVFDPTYTYPSEGSFTVTLTAANNFGCEDVTTNDHEIIAPPIAEIALTPTEGCAPLAVSFTNTTLGQYISYNWNFGTAGPPGTLANPTAEAAQRMKR